MCAHYLCRIGLSVCRYLGPAPFYLPWYNQSINQSMNQSVTWHLPYLTLPYPTLPDVGCFQVPVLFLQPTHLSRQGLIWICRSRTASSDSSVPVFSRNDTHIKHWKGKMEGQACSLGDVVNGLVLLDA